MFIIKCSKLHIGLRIAYVSMFITFLETEDFVPEDLLPVWRDRNKKNVSALAISK